MNPLRWRLLIIGAITLWSLYTVAPSVIYFATPKEVRNSDEMPKRIPSWLPSKHVSLGLDLQGGVQLVLGVNTNNAVDNKLGRIGTEAQRWSDDGGHGIAKAYVLAGKQTLRIELKDGTDIAAFKDKYRQENPGLTESNRSGQTLDFVFDETQIKTIKQSAIEQAERVVRNRVDKWGVSEPLINRRQADNSILVQLPGFKDPSKAKELLGRTAQLKFKLADDKFAGFSELAKALPETIKAQDNGGQLALVSEDREALLALVKGKVPEDRQLFLQREEIAGGKKSRFTTYVVEASTEIGGDDILDAFVTEDTTGLDRRPEVSMKFTGPGGKRFGEVTGANVGRRLVIVLDDEVVSAPVIQSKIATGQGRITLGSGSWEKMYTEAQQLSLILKSGALPATIDVLEERQVGASLGPELADEGVKGMIVGLLLVFAFMIYQYKRPGLIACAALVLNAVYLLALMALFGFSLSLPGIAGFILTLGMAVDANVLINERIRQELAEGKTSKKAIENGFSRVFWTIFDANVTTLIAGMVLLETNSSGPIRGFAVTLIIGILVSLFTSLYCTRSMFDFFIGRAKTDKEVRTWLGEQPKFRVFNFNFARYALPFAVVSGLIALAAVGATFARGLNWGVDFAGGTELQVRFAENVTPDEIEAVAKTAGVNEVALQALGGGNKQYLIRFGAENIQTKAGDRATPQEEAQKGQELKTALLEGLAAKKAEILSVDFVGPQVGKELRTQGAMSLVYAIFGILLYIAFRFNVRFGPGVLLKMFLDAFFVLAYFQIFWRSFDLTSIAAFLTVIGYSVNDTIVIFDRIRENLTSHPRRPLLENVNLSMNETLTRSINTSVVTLLSLIGILIFGSGQIWNFAMAMVVGIVAATSTSTFVASFSLVWFDKFYQKKVAAKPAAGQPQPAR